MAHFQKTSERLSFKTKIGGIYLMEELKGLFGDNKLNYDEFMQKLAEAGDTIKLANLKTGNYVDKAKYDKVETNLNDMKAKYNELSETSKNFATIQAQFDDISNKYTELVKKQEYEAKLNAILKANVDNKYAKFVYSEVNAQVDEKNDFQSVLNNYLKENSQFVNIKAPYVDLQNGNVGKSANEKMNDFIRGR